MKILQIINSLHTGGAEKLVVEIAKKYAEKSHVIDLLLLKKSHSGLEREMIEHKAIGIHFLSENRSVYSPIHILKLRKFIRKTSYDVIHVHLFPTFYWSAMATFGFFKGLLIHTEHSTQNRRMNNPVYGIIDKYVYRQYNYHITISDAVHENLKNHIRLKDYRLVKIYNGVDLKAIKNAEPISKQSLGLLKNDKIILQVSSFRPPKDQMTIIKALKSLDENIHLVLAGEGDTKKICENLVDELSLQKRVHFLGLRNDIPSLLKTADIVILSSHFEGLSLSSIEGLASGKPFIATDVPGLKEVVQGAGILFQKSNYQELAGILNRFFTDEKFYNETARACLKRSKEYDINSMVSQYLELYTVS
jgi:glycosyltransferase involved in cell wall biosynthesis